MMDGGGAIDAQATTEVADDARRRGPMRPARLQSARKRLAGASILRLFQLGDVLALTGLAVLVSRYSGINQTILTAAPIATMALLIMAGAYRMGNREPLWKRSARLAVAIVGAAGVAEVVAGLLRAEPPLRAGGAWALGAAVLLPALHVVWAQALRALRRSGLLTPNIVVVGATVAAERLIRSALQQRDVNILGIFDDRKDRVGPALLGVPVLGTTQDLITHRLLPYVDRIVITVPEKARKRVAELIDRLSPIPNPISLLLDGEEDAEEAKAVGRMADFGLAQIFGAPQRYGYQRFKRTMDLVVASAALVALLPLFVMIAAAVKLDSPGPVFFRQRRYGYLNEEFFVWKFRTMRVEASDATAARQVSANDDRVTGVGRFLRKASLDELPQILNVIRGEMSLVGPRPHAIGMLTDGEDASKLVETYAHRHRIRPGLTGWAAVNGSRGPVDTPEAVRRRIALDLQYVEHQSLWLDLAIILKTVPCLLGDTVAVR